MATPINYYKKIPEVFTALEKVHGAIDAHGLGPVLHHLVQLLKIGEKIGDTHQFRRERETSLTSEGEDYLRS